MGDLRNKARKEAETDAIQQTAELRRNGFTVFHFDFNPKLTRRNLTLGEAIRLPNARNRHPDQLLALPNPGAGHSV